MKWSKKFVFFLLHMATLNNFILFKKYTTHPNPKGKGYAFKDFILDCTEKMTEPQEREDKKDSTDDDSLVSMSPAPTPPPCK
jgi:hypothetical protein